MDVLTYIHAHIHTYIHTYIHVHHCSSAAQTEEDRLGVGRAAPVDAHEQPFQIRTRLVPGTSWYAKDRGDIRAGATQEGNSPQSEAQPHVRSGIPGVYASSSYLNKKEHDFVPSADFFRPGASGLLGGDIASPSLCVASQADCAYSMCLCFERMPCFLVCATCVHSVVGMILFSILPVFFRSICKCDSTS
jgi:hypothetical protein